jgi:hypothetical protein
MARGRMLSKSLSTSTKRARLHHVLGPPCPFCGGSLAEFAQTLYPLLVAHADDFGREVADPFTVKSTIDPSSPRQLGHFVEALLGLETVGLIKLYQDGPRILLQIIDFDEHQRGLHKRTTSKFPAADLGISGNFPEVPGNSREFLSRARAELELELELEPNLKERAARQPRPVEKPKVATLAALVRADVLPLGIQDEGELIELAKRAAARHGLRYTGSTIRRAVASARGQLAKRGQA